MAKLINPRVAKKRLVSTGASALVLNQNGIMYGWGDNTNGQLANNSITASSIPIALSQSSLLFSDVGSCDLTAAGIQYGTGYAYAWGDNSSGQLGNNAAGNTSSPVSVVGGKTFAQMATCGGINVNIVACIEAATGNAYCWGAAASGQCGDNQTASNRSSPVSVVGGKSFSQICSGTATIAAIEGNSGNAYTWGSTASGQLGTNVAGNASSPVSVVGGKSFNKISGGSSHFGAIEGNSGNAYCWGANASGQLGKNTAGNASSPASVVGGRSFVQIASGDAHTLAINSTDGVIYAWGLNGSGQLGDNTIVNRSSPVAVSGGGKSFIAISASQNNSYAIDSTGVLWSWGSNASLSMGNTFYANQLSPVSIGATSYASITTGGLIDANGNAYCWGGASTGTVGDNQIASNRSSPTSVVGGRVYKTIFGYAGFGSSTMLAIETSTGNAYAWGTGTSGQLGQSPTAVNRSSPVSVVGARSWSAIGYANTTGTSVAVEGGTGNAYAWGAGTGGIIGNNVDVNPHSSPISVVGARSFIAISCSANTVCAIEGNTGNAYAWGNGGSGQIGNNVDVANHSSPISVVGARSWRKIAGGNSMFAAIEGNSGNAYCWGLGSTGRLGTNSTTSVSSPASVVGGRSFVQIAADINQSSTLAINGLDGSIWAWGNNSLGNLGDGTANNASSPVSVHNSRSFVQVACGFGTSYGLDSTGVIWAWGRATLGSLGNLTDLSSLTPVSVGSIIPPNFGAGP